MGAKIYHIWMLKLYWIRRGQVHPLHESEIRVHCGKGNAKEFFYGLVTLLCNFMLVLSDVKYMQYMIHT